ncbi:hypothetical protein [Nonomuraea sp. NPDC050202]|uniref:hypothetical protein n=1 Tax=Nonomuraea sp. NPDC050202 TaxID=3155035 RepID=UPI0033C363C0
MLHADLVLPADVLDAVGLQPVGNGLDLVGVGVQGVVRRQRPDGGAGLVITEALAAPLGLAALVFGFPLCLPLGLLGVFFRAGHRELAVVAVGVGGVLADLGLFGGLAGGVAAGQPARSPGGPGLAGQAAVVPSPAGGGRRVVGARVRAADLGAVDQDEELVGGQLGGPVQIVIALVPRLAGDGERPGPAEIRGKPAMSRS